MDARRKRWIARAALAGGAWCAALWIGHLDFSRKISTDILDLIPGTEHSREVALVRKLGNAAQARVALFVLDDGNAAARRRATTSFVNALRSSRLFSEVVPMPDSKDREALGRFVFRHRFDLLLPGWLAAQDEAYARAGTRVPRPEWLAERAASALDTFVASPEAVSLQDLVPSDPLLLMSGLVERMTRLDGGGEDGHALVWALTAADPLDPAAQQPVMDAVRDASAAALNADPAARVRWTSVGRFALENRRRIRRELSWLNVLSLAAVLAVAALCLARVRDVIHLAPVVAGALIGAWAVTTAVFDRVQVLVFVVGSLLGGVAIDYGFYLFLQPPLYPGESYTGKVRRLLKPLLASALTTILGFSLLLWSDLPLIRQLGVFVSAGLISALATALLWFAQHPNPFARTRAFARVRLAAVTPRRRLLARVLLGVGGGVAVSGLWALHWNDDIRDLEALPPGFRNEAFSIHADFGETQGRTTYVTWGTNPADARISLGRFIAWHRRRFPDKDVESLGLVVPSPSDWRELPKRKAELRGFDAAFRGALARHGFDPAGFGPFFKSWDSWMSSSRRDYDAIVRELDSVLRGPSELLMSIGGGGAWFVSVGTNAGGAPPPDALNTVELDQLQTFNRLFSRYRRSALRLSAIGLALLGAGVFATYGIRRGATIFAVPAGSCLFALGLLGLSGQTLGLFHLLGAFLGVCLSHNYAIFSAENAARGEEPPPSIRLSALTTGASFGVLALSRIPAVAALGVTVALIVLTALAVVELGPVAGWFPAAANPARSVRT